MLMIDVITISITILEMCIHIYIYFKEYRETIFYVEERKYKKERKETHRNKREKGQILITSRRLI